VGAKLSKAAESEQDRENRVNRFFKKGIRGSFGVEDRSVEFALAKKKTVVMGNNGVKR